MHIERKKESLVNRPENQKKKERLKRAAGSTLNEKGNHANKENYSINVELKNQANPAVDSLYTTRWQAPHQSRCETTRPSTWLDLLTDPPAHLDADSSIRSCRLMCPSLFYFCFVFQPINYFAF